MFLSIFPKEYIRTLQGKFFRLSNDLYDYFPSISLPSRYDIAIDTRSFAEII